jgi:hypothetical protein
MENPSLCSSTHSLSKAFSHHSLSENERLGLAGLVDVLNKRDLSDPLPFLNIAQKLCPILLPELTREIVKLNRGNVDSLFLENLPDFSSDPYGDEKTRALTLLISSMLGNPFQYLQQNHGEIVARVTPEKGHENTNSSSGRMQFGWHTDDSCMDENLRADFIVLAGFHNPSHVKTSVCAIWSIQSELPSDSLVELTRPIYSVGIPASFRSAVSASLQNVPLFWYDGSRKLNAALSEYNVSTQEVRAQLALSELMNLANEHSEHYDLQPGTQLIFKNNRFLHARGIIPGERTVFRVYVKESLKHLRNHSLEPSFVFDLEKLFAQMEFQN